MAAARCSLTHVLAVPGQPEQQQRPVGGQRRHGDLHEPARADVLRRDRRAVGQRAAEQVGDDRPRRQPPVRRARAVVGRGQRGQLVGVLLLGVRAQDGVRASVVISSSPASSSSMEARNRIRSTRSSRTPSMGGGRPRTASASATGTSSAGSSARTRRRSSGALCRPARRSANRVTAEALHPEPLPGHGARQRFEHVRATGVGALTGPASRRPPPPGRRGPAPRPTPGSGASSTSRRAQRGSCWRQPPRSTRPTTAPGPPRAHRQQQQMDGRCQRRPTGEWRGRDDLGRSVHAERRAARRGGAHAVVGPIVRHRRHQHDIEAVRPARLSTPTIERPAGHAARPGRRGRAASSGPPTSRTAALRSSRPCSSSASSSVPGRRRRP